MGFLGGSDFGLLASQSPFGLGDGHTLSGPSADEVAFDSVETGLLTGIPRLSWTRIAAKPKAPTTSRVIDSAAGPQTLAVHDVKRT